jgi:hypothetical protein
MCTMSGLSRASCSVSNESVWYASCTACLASPESASATRSMIAMTGASCAWVKTADPVANKAVVPRIAEAACSTRSGLTEPGVEVAKLVASPEIPAEYPTPV